MTRRTRRRWGSVGGWLEACAIGLATLSFTPTVAANGVEPAKIKLPSGPGSIEGLGRSFSASQASGTASYGVEISTPPSAGGLSPDLSFEYDGGAGVSELGVGFHLGGVPSIRRRTADRLPRFDEEDRFELRGLGVPSALLELSNGFFRPEHEAGSFVRVARSKDGATWEARTKSGRILRFGGAGFVESEGDHVSAYLLREQLDLHGHRISYEWEIREGEALLASVVWNDFDPSVRQEILLDYEERPDRHELYSSGIRRVSTRRLRRLEVKLGGELVRRYDLTYGDSSLPSLRSLTLTGADGKTRLPTLSFDFTDVSWTRGDVTSMRGAPTLAPTGSRELADLNGDGLPDLLVGEAGHYRRYLNLDGESWSEAQTFSSGTSPSAALDAVGVQLADMDGDGAVDVVVKSAETSFKFFPGNSSAGFDGSRSMSPVPSFTFEDLDVRLADVSGDGLVDVLRTTPAGLQVAFNLDGRTWSAQTTLGKLDARSDVSFADGRAQLCDVNGDRLQDICVLRSGSLTYYLGRGYGRFTAARSGRGVPTFEDSAPYQVHDLNGDGWADLVQVGVTRLSVALARGAGAFGPVREIAGVPRKEANVVVRFADMNASGSVDVVWIDPNAKSDSAWKYLELFPEGRAGLLSRIDNGLGKVTRISYEPAAAHAARDRDEGHPWTTRINAAFSVVAEISVDSSCGDPVQTSRYRYRDGTWEPAERTFAGFAGGTREDVGDEHTPTLFTTNTFHTGLDVRGLRGAVLTGEQRDAEGLVFWRFVNTYDTRVVDVSRSEEVVRYGYLAAMRTTWMEGRPESEHRDVLTEYAQDDWGNVIEERHWGEVVDDDLLAGDDETWVRRTYATNESEWLLGFVASEETMTAHEERVRGSRRRYDGADFEGLPLGQIERGDLVRQEAWVGPGLDDYELDVTTRYNRDGQPIETTDARGGGRVFEWDELDRTHLTAEKVKLEKGRLLVERARFDRRFGGLLRATGYDGQEHAFEYDALGRLIAVFKPGDTDEPTTSYEYRLGAPLSRIVTLQRVGEGAFERSETLFDGLGRGRGSLTEDRGSWVLAGVTLLDARGAAWRSLRPRFIEAAGVVDPPLLVDAAGTTRFFDALGRETGTLSNQGIETKTEYRPLSVLTWDGAQLDPASSFEHTPTRVDSDGLGRTRSVTRTLNGAEVEARFDWDAAGELARRIDPEGNTTSYEYDGRGRRVRVEEPDHGAWQFEYDATNNLIARTGPDGARDATEFDRAGRVVAEDWDGDGKNEVEKIWDEHPDDEDDQSYRGRLAVVREPSGSTAFEYDERGRTRATHLVMGDAEYTVESRFDNLDREVLHVYPDRSSLRIHRNGRGQLAGYGDAVDVHFDGSGIELSRKFNTGVEQMTGHDDDLRPDEIVIRDAKGKVVEHLKWRFDAAGNVERQDDLRSEKTAESDRSETYEYDNFYRLTSARGAWGEGSWTYSTSGNLLERKSEARDLNPAAFEYGQRPHAPAKVGSRTLRYDVMGRLKSDGQRDFTWNAADQLTKVETKSGASVENTYDAEGRRRVRVETNADGKKTETHFISSWEEVKDGRLVRYIVHADRRIVRLADDNGAPQGASGARWRGLLLLPVAFAFLGAAALARTLSLRSKSRFRQKIRRGLALSLALFAALFSAGCAGDEPTDFDPKGSVRVLGVDDALLFSDQRGTTLAETNGHGQLSAEFAAYPYGVARRDSSLETRQYAGAPRDDVGLDQMGARFYAADLGIWTVPDPILITDPERAMTADFGASNAYAYANQNPIIGVDDDGEFWHIAGGAAIGAVFGGATEAASQYFQHGKVTDWGKVGSAAAGGAVSGAITAAFPGGGVLAKTAIESGANIAGGVTTRLIDSGGKSAGTLSEIAADAIVLPGGKGKKNVKSGGLKPDLPAGSAASAVPAPKIKASTKPSKPSRLQQEVKRGQAPREVASVHAGHIKGQEPHVHFCNGTSCAQSGKTHDALGGKPNPSNKAREWLASHGWSPPPRE